MKSIITITSITLFFLFNITPSSARGMLAPPPPFSGGNVGAWLGSGPMFDGQHPWGVDFPDDWDKGGGSDYSGSGGSGWELAPPGGFGYFPPQDSTANFGCDEKCQAPTLTGPCRDLCECVRNWHGVFDANFPNVTEGNCRRGVPPDDKHTCKHAGGTCWYYLW